MNEGHSGIAYGSRVTLHYSIQLENGWVADSSGNEPLTFVLGDGTLDAALESHLLGLHAGERREFAIPQGAVFPWRSDSAILTMDRADFPQEMRLEPDLLYEFHTPAGDVTPGIIVRVDETTVTVDFNHPLAGHDFLFLVEILSIE